MSQLKFLAWGIFFIGAVCLLLSFVLMVINLDSNPANVTDVGIGAVLLMISGVAIQASTALQGCARQFRLLEDRLLAIEGRSNSAELRK